MCTIGILGKAYFEEAETAGWYHFPIPLEKQFKLQKKDERKSSEIPSVPTFYVGLSVHTLCARTSTAHSILVAHTVTEGDNNLTIL